MNPEISVIMGVYNLSPRYKRAIQSILDQTFSNFEFIICDDKSTDNTLQTLKEIAKKDKRIKIISNKKNMGLGASLNHCLEIARGKYIARMDDDDFSVKDRFQIEFNFLEEHPEYSFVSSAYYIDDGSTNKYRLKEMEEKPTKESFLWNSPFLHPCTMFRAEALRRASGYRVCQETIRAEDYDLYMRMYAMGMKGYNTQKPLYVYFISQSQNKKYGQFKYFWYTAEVRAYGYKLMNIPLYRSFPYIIKPLIIGVLPMKLIYNLRTQKVQRKLKQSLKKISLK